MPKFGNKLDALINKNGGNKYRLSKEIGIDRVTLYRVINGERVPGRDFVDKLCAALRMSPAEEKELRELYEIAKIGESVFERRLRVKELVNKINSLRMEQRPGTAHKSVVVDGIEDTVKVVVGSYNVNVLVRGVLDDLAYNSRTKRLWTNASFEYLFLFDHLRQLYFEMNGTIEIEHAVKFARDAGSHKNPNINLDALASILPFIFCEGSGYHTGYYYADSTDYDSVFMPYYLFTDKRLLMLSSDFSAAMLINDPAAIGACRAKFDALRTVPLFRYVDDIAGILGVYLNIWAHSKVPDVIGIEAQPCLTGYASDDMPEKYTKRELRGRDAVISALTQHINYFRNTRTHSFFTEEGLDDFITNGFLMYSPPQVALPFDMADRKFFLNALRDDVAAGRNNSRAIDSSEISVSMNMTVQVYLNAALLFTIVNESGMRMCIIDEPSIYEAFSDFLQNMNNTKLVYSKDETLEILDKYIGLVKQNVQNT